jgi:hypothetical protein
LLAWRISELTLPAKLHTELDGDLGADTRPMAAIPPELITEADIFSNHFLEIS